MKRGLARAVKEAQAGLRASGWSHEAFTRLYDAQRQLAAARGEPWAEPLDLGVAWDGGAPLPHIVSGRGTTVLVCLAHEVDPNWDGTYVTSRGVTDANLKCLEFTFHGCHSAKLGGPNDEALSGHPLYSRGLHGYGPYLVHNSTWIRDEEAINAVHPQHRGGWHESMKHYFFVFHDEMFEALAESVSVRVLPSPISERLARAADTLAGS
jgi:hypothetical protein